MMHLCRIIKKSLHPSQIVPFAKLHHTKNGKRKSSIQHKRDDTSSNPPAILASQKSLKTGHSLILIIPNSSLFPGFSIISKRERSHIAPAPPPTPAFPPRRIPARQARDWIPGGRAAASCGNPSPTCAVDLGSTSTQGKRWEKLGRVFGSADPSRLALCDLLQPMDL